VALDLYPRPIPTPVHSLRPANGTCEQCHWPTKFVGERLKVRTHYKDDETNTEVQTALMVKIRRLRRAASPTASTGTSTPTHDPLTSPTRAAKRSTTSS